MKLPSFRAVLSLGVVLAGLLPILATTRYPAVAATTADFGLQGSATVSAACPLTLTFVGGVYGLSDTLVKYVYVRTIGNTNSVSSIYSARIPENGALDVSTTLVVDSAHAGPQSFALQLLSPGNAAVSAIYASDFTVQCGSSAAAAPSPSPAPAPLAVATPAPTPAARATNGGAQLPNVALVSASAQNQSRSDVGTNLLKLRAPNGLGSTTDPNSCAEHVNIATCTQAVDSGELVLVWNPWSGRDIDGYRVYRVDGGRHVLVTATTTFVFSGIFLTRPADGFIGKCYAITAYYGAVESADSNILCVG